MKIYQYARLSIKYLCTMAKENVYLASKPRYEILDGLRGVAALMVILFHCFATFRSPSVLNS